MHVDSVSRRPRRFFFDYLTPRGALTPGFSCYGKSKKKRKSNLTNTKKPTYVLRQIICRFNSDVDFITIIICQHVTPIHVDSAASIANACL